MWGRIISKIRKSKALFVAFAALFALTTYSFVIPNKVKSAATNQIAEMSDALQMLAGRSPGERTKAELAKAKARKTALANAGDKPGPDKKLASNDAEEPKKRSRAIAAPGEGASNILDIPDPITRGSQTAGAGSSGPVDSSPGAGGGPGFNFPGLSPSFPGGGGGGGGFFPQQPDVPAPTPTPTTPVPEPETWALMLVGMGFCGYMLRRRERVVGKISDRSCGSRAR